MEGITLHYGQSLIFKELFLDCTCKYATVAASRGFGKSVLGSVAATKAVSELLHLLF